MARHRLTLGAIALAAAAGLVVALVVVVGGDARRGSGDRSVSRPARSSTNTTIPALSPLKGPTPVKGPTAVKGGPTAGTERPKATASPATCPMPANAAKDGGWSLVATVKGAIPRYGTPGGTADGTVPATWYGGASVLPVIAEQPGWDEVRLAQRPNGSTAWVRSSDVDVASTPYWISVDLASRHVTLFHLTTPVLSAPAGVGTGSDPTPTGQYFLAFFETSPSAGYGPFIMVTSAHSTSIADWEGSGDAVVAIHGPLGADSLIGTRGAYLSHGCIRIPIADLVKLRGVPAGSPIDICG